MAQWIHFIGGRGQGGKLVAIAIGMNTDPEAAVAAFEGNQPFAVELMGLEVGTLERLEFLRDRFKSFHLRGPWYKAGTGLKTHISVLEPVDRDAARPRRVSLDLTAADFVELESLVSESGSATKQRFLRLAYKNYGRLCRYAAAGFSIQAIKDGRLVQFDNLDDVPDP